MNNFHSDKELIYKKRLIGNLVKSLVEDFPIIILTGARQVGKSTFLQKEFSEFKYITLDDLRILEKAKLDPASLWKGFDKIIIDEAQKAPEIFSEIKRTVDSTGRKARFILSGSSNILLMKNITESLAGRAVYLEMLPMSYGELNDIESPNNFKRLWYENETIKDEELIEVETLTYILKGFMPPLINVNDFEKIVFWWEGYVKTYIERDLRELSQIDSLVDFRRFMESIAYRTGNILNQTDISRDTGISQPTVYRYLKILEISNLIERLPAYSTSRTKRITKSPKLFFIDPALSVYLSQYYDRDSLQKSRELGSFFETLVFLHLKIMSSLMVPKARIFYWRTTTGKEVDFVIEHSRKIIAFEAKYTNNISLKDIKNLLNFIEDNPQTMLGVVVYSGTKVEWLHSKVLAVPWWWLAI